MTLNPSQFQPPGPVYHGSPHGFAPGDKIEPRQDRTWLKDGDRAAFGVTNTSTAGYFGVMAAAEPWEGQGRLLSSVYEVEPASQYELHPSAQKSYDDEVKYAKSYAPPSPPENTMPIDRKGFRVKRHAAWAYPVHTKEGYLHEEIHETP